MQKEKKVIKFVLFGLAVLFSMPSPAARPSDGSLSPMEQYEHLQRRLAKGWNTWDVRSVLTYVYLPYAMAIDLQLEDSVGHRVRRFRIGDRASDAPLIHPGSHAYDGSYTDLTVTWHGISLQVTTAAEGLRQVVVVRPLKSQISKLKSQNSKLIVIPKGIWGRGVEVSTETTAFTLANRDKSVVAQGQISGRFVSKQRNELCFDADQPVVICVDTVMNIDEAQHYVDRRRQDFEQHNRRQWGDQYDCYNAMQSCLAWDNIYDPTIRRVISPVSRIWSSDWFGSQDFGGFTLFCWDTYFAALMFGTDKRDLAYANAIEITLAADGLGFVPNCYYSNGYRSRDRSQPPVGSMTIWKLYERYHDRWLLELCYPRLLSWNRWWSEHRDCQGLLCPGSLPYEKVTYYGGEYTANTRYGAILETGLDNSPMYDNVTFNDTTHLLEQQDVGLTSLYIMDCRYLGRIAQELELKRDARELRRRGEHYARNMEQLWSEEDGMYYNRSVRTGQFNRRTSPTNFYPLLAKVPSQERASRMVNEHLTSPTEFWGEWVLPACSRQDPGYRDNDYWRGRIWAPLNFLVWTGLREYNFPTVTRELEDKSRQLLLKSWLKRGYVFENYNADSGEGDDTQRSDKFYHWGALLGLMNLHK